jgi:hypothetical protein
VIRQRREVRKVAGILMFSVLNIYTIYKEFDHLESFEMWSWRRMEISWTDHVRNEEVST